MRNKISIVFLVVAFGSALLAPVDSFADPPTASQVFISGIPQVGQVLTGNYTFVDAEGRSDASTFRWLHDVCNDACFEPIAGATARTYTPVAADQGATVNFEVTPVAQSGPPNDLSLTPATRLSVTRWDRLPRRTTRR